MRKIALVAAATAALSLAACSETTEDSAELTADSAVADTEANLDAMGTELETETDEVLMDAEGAATAAEAELEGETMMEADAD